MPATKSRKSSSSPSTKSKGKSTRCWPGYEPTPGKKPFTKGSCKKKEH